MSVSVDKKCCVPCCRKTRLDNVILHIFPNPDTQAERFHLWVHAIGGDILALDNQKIYKQRRVCHDHFEPRFYTTSKRLSANSVPTLHMSDSALQAPPMDVTNQNARNIQADMEIPSTSKGSALQAPPMDVTNQNARNIQADMEIPSTSKGSALRAPLMDVTNQNVTNIRTDMEIPSTSKDTFFETTSSKDKLTRRNVETTQPSPVNSGSMKLKGNQSRIFCTEASTLYRQIKKLKTAKDKYAAKLKKALKLAENPTFQKAVSNFTSTALLFILLQFREINKDKMGRRFTKKEKIMALSLYKRGPKAYRWLRNIFVLPSPATLGRIISRANLKTGINENIFQLLKKKATNLTGSERKCVLLFDEIAISPHFNYNRRRDEIVGFVDNGNEKTKQISDHALVFMIRGVQKQYKQPISYTFCAGSTQKESLVIQIKALIRKLKINGFDVVATICDQGTSNVSAVNYLISQTRADYLRAGKELKENIFEIDGQEIIPLFDPPHLMKGIRNNLLNKNLKCDIDKIQKVAKWDHIVQLYHENPAYQGLRLLPKLTENHVNPNKIPKMKVKMATQVFSRAVAVNMGYLAEIGILDAQCKETADVLLFFDELFDSVNGSYEGARKNAAKPLLGPLTPSSCHQIVWEKARTVLKSMKFVTSNGKTSVVPSIANWLRTIENFLYLKTKIFGHDLKSVWLRHFNQDPLENFFGCIRSHGVRNINPTSAGFEVAFVSLLINNVNNSVHSSGANCEKDSCFNFKCFKQLFYKTRRFSNSLTEIKFEHLNDQILLNLQEKIKNPKIKAHLEYVAGYVLRKTRKFFKGCKECKDCLYDKQNKSVYIKRKEHSNKIRRLSYPATDFVKTFSYIQDVVIYIIRHDINMPNIKAYMKMVISYHIRFDFIKCDDHRAQLAEEISDLSCRFFLNNWCRDTNKILKGKRTDYDTADSVQIYAFRYCSKRNKSTPF